MTNMKFLINTTVLTDKMMLGKLRNKSFNELKYTLKITRGIKNKRFQGI